MIPSEFTWAPAMGCPSRKLLRDFLSGNLPDDDADVLVVSHSSKCSHCGRILKKLSEETDSIAIFMRRAAGNFEEEEGCKRGMEKLRAMRVNVESLSQTLESFEPSLLPEREPVPIPNPFGKYDLLDQIGKGGMGRVFCARHRNLKSKVAIKILATERIHDQRDIDRFYGEMEAVGKLNNPNVIRATDAGDYKGHHYLAMDYYDGLSLSELLHQVGRLGCADACELVRQAALGLQCAHQHGMVHRDVKPSNLLLTTDGVVKLLDLGLVWFQADGSTGGLTDNGTSRRMIIGTADYMAPEQWTGQRNIDPRTDVYGLGCTLYRLLTDDPPFGANEVRSRDKMDAHLNDQVPQVTKVRPDLPKVLNEVFSRALAKHPDDRFSDMQQFIESIEPLAEGSDLKNLARPATDLRNASTARDMASLATAPIAKTGDGTPIPSRRRLKWIIAAVMVFVVAVVSTSAYLLIRGTSEFDQMRFNSKKNWRDLKIDDARTLYSSDLASTISFVQGDQQEEIHLNARDWLFVSLAETKKRDYRFRVTMKPGQGNLGDAGVFIGLRPHERPLEDSVLMFRVESTLYKNGKPRYSFHIDQFFPRIGNWPSRVELLSVVAYVSDSNEDLTVALIVEDSRLVGCSVNGAPVRFDDSVAVKLSKLSEIDGPMGVYGETGSIRFIKPQFCSE